MLSIMKKISAFLFAFIVLYVIEVTVIFMFSVWTTVEKKAEFVYYYGSGIGAMLVGISAVFAIARGMSQFERASIYIEERKFKLSEDKENLRREAVAFDLAMEVLENFDTVLRMIKSTVCHDISEKEQGEISIIYNKGVKISITDILGFAVLYRIGRVRDVLDDLWKAQPKFKILFGSDEPFIRISRLITKIQGSAEAIAGSLSDEQWAFQVPIISDKDESTANECDSIREQLHDLIYARISPEKMGNAG
ncbi:hypothetical protein [Azospirillum sp. TSA6c]|uniref:hypothetical protein n=1 Tax=unclassified Azospirillum TaxID=2630922 RepID=UPI0011B590FA|nr:hypothetical protein [Azospirillum sp. TSA6c]